MTVRSKSVQLLFLPKRFAIKQRFHRRPAATHFSLMGSFSVVVINPYIQIFLEVVDISIELSPKRDLIKLLQNRLVESFADTIGLGDFTLALARRVQ